ncbi:hypothetical protein EDC96DRAFT_543219 [Choanephora cucurbitarum]|nr:hypothetical protein EDC96DRAFT_543219 [Choanephora cucurbitarum]
MYRAFYKMKRDRTIEQIKITGEIADVPIHGVFLMTDLRSGYIMQRQSFFCSRITKYIGFNTTVSDLKSQQQICIFNLELANSFSPIPDQSTSWGYWPGLFRYQEKTHSIIQTWPFLTVVCAWDFWVKSYVYSEQMGADLVLPIKSFIVLQHENPTVASDYIGKVYCLAHFMQPRSYPEMSNLRLEYKHNDPTECIRLFQDVLSNHVILSLKCTNIHGKIKIQKCYVPLELEKLREERNAICMYWPKRKNEESSTSADMSCTKETEHVRRTMSRQETYKRTDTTLIRRRFIDINTILTSSDNNYIYEKACESVIN